MIIFFQWKAGKEKDALNQDCLRVSCLQYIPFSGTVFICALESATNSGDGRGHLAQIGILFKLYICVQSQEDQFKSC